MIEKYFDFDTHGPHKTPVTSLGYLISLNYISLRLSLLFLIIVYTHHQSRKLHKNCYWLMRRKKDMNLDLHDYSTRTQQQFAVHVAPKESPKIIRIKN